MNKFPIQSTMTIVTPDTFNHDRIDYNERHMDFLKGLGALFDQSDIVRLVLKDSSVRYCAEMNFHFGECDCCSTIDMSDVVQYVGVKFVWP